MFSVTFTGWDNGFSKVRFTRLLRAEVGLGLAESRRLVDLLLGGSEFSIAVPNRVKANSISLRALELGINAVLVEEPR